MFGDTKLFYMIVLHLNKSKVRYLQLLNTKKRCLQILTQQTHTIAAIRVLAHILMHITTQY